MNFLKTNHVTLHYKLTKQSENAPVLVFSNSLGTDYRIWDTVTALLADDYTILRYDKRGHGLSELGPTPYSLDDHIGDLCALLDHLDLKKVILCGLSVGGMIAQGVGAARPDLVSGLILCDTGHIIGTREIWQDRIGMLENEDLSAMVDPVMERWFTAEFRQPDNSTFSGCKTMFERQDKRGYSATCTAIQNADLTESTKKLTVPTLCVVGDQDAATSPELVKELASLIKGAEYQVIKNAGHIPCVEQPEILSESIRDFTMRKHLREIRNG